jgi:LNS2 (Lipin/Ned1/Smp2)
MWNNGTAYDLILVVRSSAITTEEEGGEEDGAAAALSECMYWFGSSSALLLHETATTATASTISTTTPPGVTCVQLVVTVGDATLQFQVNDATRQLQNPGDVNTVLLAAIRRHQQQQLQQQRQKQETTTTTAANGVVSHQLVYPARFLLMSNADGETSILGIAETHIYVWCTPSRRASPSQIVVMDVDGTITRSTLLGFLVTAVFQRYNQQSVAHAGVCQFLQSVVAAGPGSDAVRIVYLTNRPITYADRTKEFLHRFQQGEARLPDGPLIGFTGGLAGVFKVGI